MDNDLQAKVEYLKLIQGVIARMVGNSAHVKTWAVSLVTAAFVFSGISNDPHWLIGLGASVPVVAFWIMDARYLHLERCYIQFYSAVTSEQVIVDFSLDYRPHVHEVASVWRVAWSWSVCTFYGSLLLLVLFLILVLAK